jgi:Phage portal protein
VDRMSLWDRLFPMASRLPLQPQIEAWTDNSHLYDVLAADLGIDPALLPLNRGTAMRVPAVSRARNLTCGTIADLPLRVLRVDTPIPTQPYWVYGTDGQLGELTEDQQIAWGITPQGPWHRMLWTIDDLFFHGESLWLGTTYSTGARPLPLRIVRVPYDHWHVDGSEVLDPDNRPYPADQVIYIPGPNEGILNFGATSIVTAADLERVAADVASHPLRLEAHQTTAAELPPEERRAISAEIRQAMATNDGVIFTNSAIDLKEHRVDAEAIQLGARNASALDVARHANMPALMLDATSQGASLEYQTLEGRNQQWLDYGLNIYIGAIDARLSMDDVVAAGQRVALDTSDWTTATPSPTGPPQED